MKHLILMILALFIQTTSLFSQSVELSELAGEWKWTSSDSNEEFKMILRTHSYTISPDMGGGARSCLIGVYKYTKQDVVLIDCLDELDHSKDYIEYPIIVYHTMGLRVRDYLMKNGKGKHKRLGGDSRIEDISNNYKQIRWVLDYEEEQVAVVFDDENEDDFFFPEGTSLPTNIILTKVE